MKAAPKRQIVDAVKAVRAGDLTQLEAVRSADPAEVEALLHSSMAGDAGDVSAERRAPVATGIGASPGAAAGQVYFDVDAALDAADRGETVLLAAVETTPADEPAMHIADGIITASGGLASHAAVVARGWGLPAVCGAETLTFDVAAEPRTMSITTSDGVVVITEGETVTIDGAAGEIYQGDLGVDAAGVPDELFQLLAWADEVRGDAVGVRTNADTAADAAKARELGAEGIGLCRTEHMFLGARLPVVQRVLRSDEGSAEADAAIAELVEQQRADFGGVLEAMDGLPVIVRLLDAPLHEFLPENDEHNPMLGVRGVRLAIRRPSIYLAQVRALALALDDRRAAGGAPVAEVMIPLVSAAGELRVMAEMVRGELASHGHDDVPVGTMIETPRAALTAAELAPHADFFSFGTNDLTQLTFGFSRDDLEAPIIGRYIDDGVLATNPFAELDQSGVGQLVTMAIENARAAAPDLSVGICGEHGGNPASIRTLVAAGVDYVSCSPFRVPVARLTAAQLVAELADDG